MTWQSIFDTIPSTLGIDLTLRISVNDIHHTTDVSHFSDFFVSAITAVNKGYKQTKAKLGMRRVRPWKWTPFVNRARSDGAVLYHWRRPADQDTEYAFAKFNKVRPCVPNAHDRSAPRFVVPIEPIVLPMPVSRCHMTCCETFTCVEEGARIEIRRPSLFSSYASVNCISLLASVLELVYKKMNDASSERRNSEVGWR